ncbi:unnamed protein product, partial [Prorocentrum cordatum]
GAPRARGGRGRGGPRRAQAGPRAPRPGGRGGRAWPGDAGGGVRGRAGVAAEARVAPGRVAGADVAPRRVVEVQEVAPTIEAWAAWFQGAVRAVLRALPTGGAAVFYQTDVRLPEELAEPNRYPMDILPLQTGEQELPGTAGRLGGAGRVPALAQGGPLRQRRQALGLRPAVHPLAVPGAQRRAPGRGVARRPGGLREQHTRRCGARAQAPAATEQRAVMGVNATLLVLKWAMRRIAGLRLVVDPFCGAGTTLAVANFLGLRALGVDLSPRRVKQAAALDVSELLTRERRATDGPEDGPAASARHPGSLGSSAGSTGLCTVHDADADDNQRTQYRFVPDPVPETFHDVQHTVDGLAHGRLSRDSNGSRDSRGSKIVPLTEIGLRGGRNVTIMGYVSKRDRGISGELARGGGDWESHILSSLCDPWHEEGARGGHFLDVGANIGTYTLPMADCIRGSGSVISVEGMPSIAEHLRAGIVENKAENVVLYNYAIGGDTPENSVVMQLDGKNKGGSHITGNKPGASGVYTVEVPLTTLDSMLHQDPRMRAILSAKVDIEGNEGRMLRGAEELFSKYPPCYLCIELVPEWLNSTGTPVEVILPMLKDYGYRGVPETEWFLHSSWRAKTIRLHQKAHRAWVASLREVTALDVCDASEVGKAATERRSCFPDVWTWPRAAMAELASLASGASPHQTSQGGAWAPPQQQSAPDELRKAVAAEDWARNYTESIRGIRMQADWSAGPERCAMLQAIAATSRARRVLEVGSFCGAAALALAEALPEGGEVLSLELDEYAVDFAKRFQTRSPFGHKIKHMVGPAETSLKELAEKAVDGKPFDLVVLDADKERMEMYLDLLRNTPGMLSEDSVVCIDLTPFKGQPPLRYQKYGFPYLEEGSGQKAIDALRARMAAEPDVAAYEFGQMMVVQRRRN